MVHGCIRAEFNAVVVAEEVVGDVKPWQKTAAVAARQRDSDSLMIVVFVYIYCGVFVVVCFCVRSKPQNQLYSFCVRL